MGHSSPTSNTFTEDPDAISYADTLSSNHSPKPKTVRWDDYSNNHSAGNSSKKTFPSISTNNRKNTATRITARLTNGQNPLKLKRTRDNITDVRVAMYRLGMLPNTVKHCPPPINIVRTPSQCLCSLCYPDVYNGH